MTDLPANYPIALQQDTAYCVVSAASRFQLPPEALLSVMFVEGGKPGTQVQNKDLSWDLGIMQINSLWLKDKSPIKGYVDWQSLRDNPCVNIHAAAWIMASLYQKHKNLWTAVGAYHAPYNESLASAYRQRVNRKLPYARYVLQNSPFYGQYISQFFRPNDPVSPLVSRQK